MADATTEKQQQCPNQDVLSQYFDGRLPLDDAASAHIENCPDCQKKLQKLHHCENVWKSRNEKQAEAFPHGDHKTEVYRKIAHDASQRAKMTRGQKIFWPLAAIAAWLLLAVQFARMENAIDATNTDPLAGGIGVAAQCMLIRDPGVVSGQLQALLQAHGGCATVLCNPQDGSFLVRGAMPTDQIADFTAKLSELQLPVVAQSFPDEINPDEPMVWIFLLQPMATENAAGD